MRSCKNCFNLKVKLPLTNGMIMYDDGLAYCSEGELIDIHGRPRTFKRILRRFNNRSIKSFLQAERCPFYVGEDDEKSE